MDSGPVGERGLMSMPQEPGTFICFSYTHADMDRFLVPKAVAEASDLQKRLQQTAQQYHAAKHKGKTRGSYNKKPWAHWSIEKRAACAQEYVRNGISGVRLRYGTTHPSPNTIAGWAKAVASDRCLRKAGRPSALTPEESNPQKEAFDATRTEGAPIDRELIVLLAEETVQATQPTQEEPEQPQFTKEWAAKWAKCNELTKKKGSTDRPLCTIEDLVEDNAWRQKLLDIMERPAAYGIHMLDGYAKLLPTFVYACDETVLHYSPDMRGTYEDKAITRVYLMNQGEKRHGTATPILDMNSDTLCLQVIFRGETTACHAKTTKIAHLVHPAILQDHAKATWKQLMRNVHEKNQVKLKDFQLPETFPILMVADRAPAHLTAADVEEVRGAEFCEDLVKLTDSDVYVYKGRANRIHARNARDQLTNKSCRDAVRSGMKKCMLHHALAIRAGRVPPGSPLDLSEAIIEPLVLIWLSQWLNTAALNPGTSCRGTMF